MTKYGHKCPHCGKKHNCHECDVAQRECQNNFDYACDDCAEEH